jgi:hypothetical protein
MATQREGQLSGAVSTRTVEIDEEEVEILTQEGYGDWPICPICRRTKTVTESQIDPTEWSEHTESHIS